MRLTCALTALALSSSITCFLAAADAGTPETPTPTSTYSLEEGPWTDIWGMELRGAERIFVEYNGVNYMAIEPADFATQEFLTGKEILLTGKYDRLELSTVHLFGMPVIDIHTVDTKTWSTVADGDNIYMLGIITSIEPSRINLDVHAVVHAASDAQLLDDMVKAIDATNHSKLYELATWIRQEALSKGNRGYWDSRAESVCRLAIQSAVTNAQATVDTELFLLALSWSEHFLRDQAYSATVASAEWITSAPPAFIRAISTHMSSKGFVLQDSIWMTQADSLTKECAKRFAAIHWSNADAYYELSQWIDQYGDVLPDASQLRHKTLQAGLAADDTHNGIRRALGMPLVSNESTANIPTDYTHQKLKLTLPGPEDWKRSAVAISGDATWTTPESDTAYISLKIIEHDSLPTTIDGLWSTQLPEFSNRSNYAVSPTQLSFNLPMSRSLVFTYSDGKDNRQGILVVAHRGNGQASGYGIRLFCSCLIDDVTTPQAYSQWISQQIAQKLTTPQTTRPGMSDSGISTVAPEGETQEDRRRMAEEQRQLQEKERLEAERAARMEENGEEDEENSADYDPSMR